MSEYRVKDVTRWVTDEGRHTTVEVYRDDVLIARGCGDNWHDGTCGLPAILADVGSIRAFGEPYKKVSGSQVACGAVLQDLRVHWVGERIMLDAETTAVLAERYYL